ncbi:MAG: hypothetical protein ACK5PS_06585 [Desulfopila sp.]
MSNLNKNEEYIIEIFHQMWDEFPGFARLIDQKHKIIASNKMAEEKGFIPGEICSRVGQPQSHKECKLRKTFSEKSGNTDRVLKDRVRGWVPIQGCPDLLVHFTLLLPDE